MSTRPIPKDAKEAEAQSCRRMFCPTAEDCAPFVQPCKTAADCYPSSCCAIIMLDAVSGNIPGSAIPEGRVQRCENADAYCQQPLNICVVSEPSWRGFTDADAIGVLQGKIADPITEAQQMAFMARAEALRLKKIKEAEEQAAQEQINNVRIHRGTYWH